MKVELEEKISNLTELDRFAEKVGARLRLGDWLWLEGQMGAGKTTFVRSLMKAYNIDAAVSSPTYPLLLEYEHTAWDAKVIHIDAFRLKEKSTEIPWDWREWKRALVLVEWPENSGLPKNHFPWMLKIEMQSKDQRLYQLISGPFS